MILASLLLLALSAPANPDRYTDMQDIAGLQEFKRNQESYNAQEHTRVATRIDEVFIILQQREARIEQLEKSQTQMQLIASLLGIGLPILLTFLYSRSNAQLRAGQVRGEVRDKALKATEDRLHSLEIHRIHSSQERALVRRLGKSLVRAFAKELHHPTGHDAADLLLDVVIDGGTLTPRQRDELTELMAARRNDTTVSLRERTLAKEMSAMIEVMEQWEECPEADPEVLAAETEDQEETYENAL